MLWWFSIVSFKNSFYRKVLLNSWYHEIYLKNPIFWKLVTYNFIVFLLIDNLLLIHFLIFLDLYTLSTWRCCYFVVKVLHSVAPRLLSSTIHLVVVTRNPLKFNWVRVFEAIIDTTMSSIRLHLSGLNFEARNFDVIITEIVFSFYLKNHT